MEEGGAVDSAVRSEKGPDIDWPGMDRKRQSLATLVAAPDLFWLLPPYLIPPAAERHEGL